jgi:hypothetical protein
VIKSVYSSGTKINVKISSCGEQRVSYDEKENVSYNSSIQHDINTDLEDPQ